MSDPTQFDKARYSLYTLILFLVLSWPLVINKSRLLINAVVFGLIVFGLMHLKGI